MLRDSVNGLILTERLETVTKIGKIVIPQTQNRPQSIQDGHNVYHNSTPDVTALMIQRRTGWPSIAGTLSQRILYTQIINCGPTAPTPCRWPNIEPTFGQCVVCARYILGSSTED